MAGAWLSKRGSLSIWFDPETQWLAAPTGKRSRQPVFTDAAIQACLTLKALFGLPLRQIEPWERHWSECPWRGGMVASLLELARLDWPVPDFSTLCRLQTILTVHIPIAPTLAPCTYHWSARFKAECDQFSLFEPMQRPGKSLRSSARTRTT